MKKKPNFQKAFKELSRSTVAGIPGVWVVESGKPGPAVGITVMTHGNEPSGLAVYHYFRHIYRLNDRIQRGSIYFVLNNPGATRKYLVAVAERDEKKKKEARFVDVNMNRLPNDTLSLSRSKKYEIRRARALRPIWDRLEYALDIHSVREHRIPAMIIALRRSALGLVSRFPIKTIISSIDDVQAGKPACYFFGRKRGEVYGIEAGSHEAKSSFRRAITCTRTFLGLLGVISPAHLPLAQDQVEYRVFDAVWFPDESYELTRKIKSFQPIKRGEVLARGNGKPIIAKTDCYALMPPRGKKPVNITEEVMFLTKAINRSARR